MAQAMPLAALTMVCALGACTPTGPAPSVAAATGPSKPSAARLDMARLDATRPSTALPGPVSASNPSTAIVDINRSVPQALGPNSPPPSTFENSCAPAPYLFQSRAGYEAVRVKDCRNDQLVYLPSSARTQIDIYTADCQRKCG